MDDYSTIHLGWNLCCGRCHRGDQTTRTWILRPVFLVHVIAWICPDGCSGSERASSDVCVDLCGMRLVAILPSRYSWPGWLALSEDIRKKRWLSVWSSVWDNLVESYFPFIIYANQIEEYRRSHIICAVAMGVAAILTFFLRSFFEKRKPHAVPATTELLTSDSP